MRTSIRTAVVVICIGATVAGCATKAGTGAAVGAATGAGVGALVGRVGGDKGSLIGAAAGALVGAAIGALIGHSMDVRDQAKRDAAMQETLKKASADEKVAWVNPDTGNSGTIKPLTEARAERSGPVCREFEETYTRDAKTVTQKSSACLNQDGTWVMRN